MGGSSGIPYATWEVVRFRRLHFVEWVVQYLFEPYDPNNTYAKEGLVWNVDYKLRTVRRHVVSSCSDV